MPTPAGADWRAQLGGLFLVLKNRQVWLISWSAFIRYGILAAVQGLWAGPYLMDVMGYSPVTAGNLLFLLTLGVVIGNPVSGFLSDRIFKARKGIMVVALAGLSLTLAGLAFVPVGAPLWLLVAFFSAFGIFAGTGSIPYAHLKELTPPDRSATALTVLNFFAIVGAGVFMQGLGLLMKALYPASMLSHEAFVAMFLVCAGAMLVGAVLYAFTREGTGDVKRKTQAQRECEALNKRISKPDLRQTRSDFPARKPCGTMPLPPAPRDPEQACYFSMLFTGSHLLWALSMNEAASTMIRSCFPLAIWPSSSKAVISKTSRFLSISASDATTVTVIPMMVGFW